MVTSTATDGSLAGVLCRPARPDEAAELTELALRSKGHWGYDEEFLAACRAGLTIAPADVVAQRVTVAEIDGRVAGFYSIVGDPPVVALDMLFVDPPAIGRGIGRSLWWHAVEAATALGVTTLTVHADPFAEGFYLAMGAVRSGAVPSGSIPGRELPRLTFTTSGRERAG